MPFVAGGQGLVACALLNIALELFRTCRRCATWMANDPYDLAHAPAPTAARSRHGQADRSLAVSAAAVTDHVRDNRYGRDLQWQGYPTWRTRTPDCGQNSRTLRRRRRGGRGRVPGDGPPSGIPPGGRPQKTKKKKGNFMASRRRSRRSVGGLDVEQHHSHGCAGTTSGGDRRGRDRFGRQLRGSAGEGQAAIPKAE